jgi:ubiquinol-cytochrome c reductase cytochrome c subunit
MRLLVVALLAAAACVVTAQTPASRPNTTTPAGNAVNGKKIYVSYGCYECHGYEGQGGAAGARLAPRPPLALQAFINYVRLPKEQMPPYTSKVVTDQELADIYAFLQSVTPPPAASSIPQLNN